MMSEAHSSLSVMEMRRGCHEEVDESSGWKANEARDGDGDG